MKWRRLRHQEPQLEMANDSVHHIIVGNESDDLYLAPQWKQSMKSFMGAFLLTSTLLPKEQILITPQEIQGAINLAAML